MAKVLVAVRAVWHGERVSTLSHPMDRRIFLRTLAAAAGLSVGLGGLASARAQSGTMRVNAPEGLLLRAGPAPNATVLTGLAPGTGVQVTGGAVGSWVPVQVGDQAGWVDGAYLEVGGTTSSPLMGQVQALSGGVQAVINTDAVNVRGGPGVANPLVATLAGGARVDVISSSIDGRWWRVAADTVVGYVDGQYLQATGEPLAVPAFDVDLPLIYTPQLTPLWCDPADIQMWLGLHGVVPSAGSYAFQQAVWAWETTHNAGFTVEQWDCSPYAVASAAHQWLPAAGFDHFLADDPLKATRLMAWQLANGAGKEPSIALIWRGDHYVIVRGVRVLGDTGRLPDQSEILGVYVADPNRDARSWLGEDRFVPIDRWLTEMLTPVTYLTPHTGIPGDTWQDQIVTIQRTWNSNESTLAGQRNVTPGRFANA